MGGDDRALGLHTGAGKRRARAGCCHAFFRQLWGQQSRIHARTGMRFQDPGGVVDTQEAARRVALEAAIVDTKSGNKE